MIKINKFAAIGLAAVTAMSAMSISAFAENVSEDKIQIVEVDDNGNEGSCEDLIYLEEVAKRYEEQLKLRWTTTTFYNLGNGPYSIYNTGAIASIMCNKHFNANSNGRLYYTAQTEVSTAYVDIYDITNKVYKGSFSLIDQGDGTYSRDGVVKGLSTSNYYSFGLSRKNSNFSNCYASIAWNEL